MGYFLNLDQAFVLSSAGLLAEVDDGTIFYSNPYSTILEC